MMRLNLHIGWVGDHHLITHIGMDLMIHETFSSIVKENFYSHFTILNIANTNRCKRLSIGNERYEKLGVWYEPTQPSLQREIFRSRWRINEIKTKFDFVKYFIDKISNQQLKLLIAGRNKNLTRCWVKRPNTYE